MEITGVSDLDELYALLTKSASTSRMWDRLISALTVGETYFFRNTNQFDALTQHILPDLLIERGHLNRRIRIWTAGCATGEEPYSIAIALRELIPQIESWNILILATDINRDALRKAQQGVYGAWSFRGVERRIQETYFRMTNDKQFAIADEIKRMVTFDYLNLVADPFPSLTNNTNAMDLVFCRNVTIYFTAEVTQKLVHDFCNCLVDGGWLIPGPSEPNLLFYNDFEVKNFPGTVIYRKPMTPKAKAAPLFAFPSPPVVSTPAPVLPVLPRKESPKPAPRPQPPARLVPPRTVDPYQAAQELFQNGQVDQALVKLHEKLEQDPGAVPTYCLLGKIYANKGNLEEAQHWCEQAIQREKLHPEPYYTLSMIYQQHGLMDMAVEMLKKTIYLDRSFVLAHYNLAQIYQHQGEKALASKSLQNVQQLLSGKPRDELVPEGDGLIAGRLMELVESQLAQENYVST
jgi:chemotaxis protein methyltransferase CheR